MNKEKTLMRIKQLPTKEENFITLECSVNGLDVSLVYPNHDVEWNKENLIFRSSIWKRVNDGWELVSAGFPKFFNYGEKPDLYPDPQQFRDWNVLLKYDGTCVIVDWINGKLSIRTRGSFSYETQKNADDFLEIIKQHPNLESFLQENEHLTLLFELETPNNVIIVRQKEIKVTLLAAIDKRSYTFVDITEIAKKINAQTPQQFYFRNMNELVQTIQKWVGQEGVVLVYNNNQNRVKVKSEWYLRLHKLKSHFTPNVIIELCVRGDFPNEEQMFEIVEKTIDYEIAIAMKDQISKIARAGLRVKQQIANVQKIVGEIAEAFSDRKSQAQAIKARYQNSPKMNWAFALLDGKQIAYNTLEQALKNELSNEK